MAQRIRLLLVDDHSLFREGLSRLLAAEDGFEMAGDASSVTDALAILGRELVDMVLLDFDLGDRQGLDFLTEARRQNFAGRILMVTAGMSDGDTLRALERGASGIFLKHSPPAELLRAIQKINAGEIWIDPAAVHSLITAATYPRNKKQAEETLTARERAVLKAVFEGQTNKEIAAKLDISEGYVKAVLQQLFDKTGVRTRGQLVRIALERHSQYRLDLELENNT